jgi:hypothetical protein
MVVILFAQNKPGDVEGEWKMLIPYQRPRRMWGKEGCFFVFFRGKKTKSF